eukprot:TRINITY_DN9346_c0_g1_i1.p1 TRINITY_DN9346_c0_g1~~TRINITY_DN9346_c0_g1_i1.p1  ORF type:complete len:284 (+),score=65.33 TRINITY_DN9346_c0_g1_i1:93-944(+)
MPSLVGSEMCIRDSINAEYMGQRKNQADKQQTILQQRNLKQKVRSIVMGQACQKAPNKVDENEQILTEIQNLKRTNEELKRDLGRSERNREDLQKVVSELKVNTEYNRQEIYRLQNTVAKAASSNGAGVPANNMMDGNDFFEEADFMMGDQNSNAHHTNTNPHNNHQANKENLKSGSSSGKNDKNNSGSSQAKINSVKATLSDFENESTSKTTTKTGGSSSSKSNLKNSGNPGKEPPKITTAAPDTKMNKAVFKDTFKGLFQSSITHFLDNSQYVSSLQSDKL